MLDPALGARSKREIEIMFVQLIFMDKLDTVSVAEAASRLNLPRRRAINLLLEARLRAHRDESDESRYRRMLEVLDGGKDGSGLVGITDKRLEIVLDNPEIRERLKSFASANRIPIDGAFSEDLLRISWESWKRMVEILVAHLPDITEEAFTKAVLKNLKAQTAFLNRSELNQALNRLSAREGKVLAKVISAIVTAA